MEFVPHWAPNIHPMVVHFPIALVITAIGADLLALVLEKWEWLRPATVALYVAGGASAVVTYITGTWAAEVISVPAAAEAVLSKHANLGWWTMWFFGTYAVLRLGLKLFSSVTSRRSVRVVLILIALGGGYLVYETGMHGAEMVFRYGIGVQAPEEETVSVEPGLTVGGSGWQWQPQSDTAWTARMEWLEGSPSDIRATLDTTRKGAIALRFRATAPAAFVVPDTLGAVQVSAELNLDGFDGTVSLLHHVQNRQEYDFLAIDGSALRQGRVVDGERLTFSTGTAQTGGGTTIRAVGDGTHFRGYVDGTMVVHGHGDAATPGRVGLRVDGTGTLLLRRLSAEAL